MLTGRWEIAVKRCIRMITSTIRVGVRCYDYRQLLSTRLMSSKSMSRFSTSDTTALPLWIFLKYANQHRAGIRPIVSRKRILKYESFPCSICRQGTSAESCFMVMATSTTPSSRAL